MSEVHPVAIFADQITVGMLIEHWNEGQRDGRVHVTQVRARTEHFEGVGDRRTVFILGEREDGSPFVYRCGEHMAWLCYEARVAVE